MFDFGSCLGTNSRVLLQMIGDKLLPTEFESLGNDLLGSKKTIMDRII